MSAKFSPPTETKNRLVRITEIQDICQGWEFWRQSLDGLKEKAGVTHTPEKYFLTLCKVLSMNHRGLVLMLVDEHNKPLGCGCAFDAEDFNGDSCFYIWSTYSSGECKTTLSELLRGCEEFAKSLGHSTVKLATPRISGAADRLFEGLGFEREFVTYRKSI